ncbi:hypothetical protein FNYG_02986 [Fusarium nygamai]|uniref:Uncharacterized protein n=1 Tax=Gibberella nygamai TaxID=42673 RepID=A0A2K0WMC9_GIBNY|nr:hypothetical protein FNYG_02986 [Fusarium nygamai]
MRPIKTIRVPILESTLGLGTVITSHPILPWDYKLLVIMTAEESASIRLRLHTPTSTAGAVERTSMLENIDSDDEAIVFLKMA